MASAAELETALRNADAAGDTEGAKILAGELMRVRQMPAERPGGLERFGRGFVQGLRDPVDALGQMKAQTQASLGMPGAAEAAASTDADIRARNEAYKRDVRGGQGDFDWGRFAGNVIPGLAVSALVPPAAGVMGAAATGAIGGAVSGALQPVTQGDFWSEKGKQAAVGGVAGGASGVASNLLSRVISPNVSPEVALLRKEGVTPTPGQILGGGFKSAEEKLSSTPLVGQAIKSGQQRATEQFNEAAVNRALAPIGGKLPKGTTGREAVEYASDALKQAYDDALSAVGPITLDQQLSAALRQTYGNLGVLPKDKADQFARILQIELGNRAQNGVLTPEAMKAAESNLGQLARGYMRSQDFDQRKLGEAILEAQDALRATVQRQAPAGASEAVKAANAGWANFKRVERAATYVGAEDGVFNASQLQSAVKALDPSKDKSKFAKGGALMQDLSEAGKKVLGNKVPNSGSPERLAAIAALNPGTWPYIAAGIPASLMYTGPGQNLAAGLLAGRQGPVAGLLSDATRRLAIPGGMALTPALQGLLAE